MQDKLTAEVADRMFAYIAELDEGDDPDDYTKWIKANPSLGTLLHLNDLREQWERAKKIPAERADFICKQLNVTVNTDDMAFIQPEALRRNVGTIDEDALLGRRCYGGFDRFQPRGLHGRQRWNFLWTMGAFMCCCTAGCRACKVELDQEKIDYYGLAMRGYLTIVEGEYIQQEDVYEWFVAQSKKYELMTYRI